MDVHPVCRIKVSLMKCLIQKHSVAVSWGDTPPILPIAVIQQSVPSDTTGMEGSIVVELCCSVILYHSGRLTSWCVTKSKNQGIPGLCKNQHNPGDFCEKTKQRNKGKKVLVDCCIEAFAEMIP